MGPVIAIATTTLGEAIRRRVLLIILLIGVVLLTMIPAFGVLTARAELSTTISAMFFTLRGTSAMIAIVLSVYMIPNEIERRTIYTILSKPVQRWQFLVGKYLGAVFSLALMITLMGVVMITLFYLFQHPPMSKLLDLARQAVMYLVEMSLLAAVAIFFSTFVAPLVNFFITFGLWLVGSLLNPLYSSIENNSATAQGWKMMAKGITVLLPNFSSYDVKNPLLSGGATQIGNESVYYLTSMGYGLLYIVILLIGGILIFDRREV